MKEDINLHLNFDSRAIIVSPDIVPIFHFLAGIEEEVKSLMGVVKKLELIRDQHLEQLEFVLYLTEKLKENGIDFTYSLKEHPEDMAKKLEYQIPLRSQFIVLFVNLEAIFYLWLSYEKETSDKKMLIDYSIGDDRKLLGRFINKYILNGNNRYYAEHRKRFGKTSQKKLRELRNTLIHFFSMSENIQLCTDEAGTEARKLEKLLMEKGENNTIFISPTDLYELIKEGGILLIEEWSGLSEKNSVEFNRKISFPLQVIRELGPVGVDSSSLRL